MTPPLTSNQGRGGAGRCVWAGGRSAHQGAMASGRRRRFMLGSGECSTARDIVLRPLGDDGRVAAVNATRRCFAPASCELHPVHPRTSDRIDESRWSCAITRAHLRAVGASHRGRGRLSQRPPARWTPPTICRCRAECAFTEARSSLRARMCSGSSRPAAHDAERAAAGLLVQRAFIAEARQERWLWP